MYIDYEQVTRVFASTYIFMFICSLNRQTQKHVQHMWRYVFGPLQLVTTNLEIFVFHCGAMGPNCAKNGSIHWWRRPCILVVRYERAI